MDEDTNGLLLAESLAKMVQDISRFTDFHQSHKRQCINLIRRIKLLLPLFEEMIEVKSFLPEAIMPVFKTLEQVLQSAKVLLQSCHGDSKLYLILECETIAKRFSAVSDNMDQALNRMPWDVLNPSEEVREQVDLVHYQFNRAKVRADTENNQLHADLMLIMFLEDDTNVETAFFERVADKLQLTSRTELEAEARTLKHMIRERSPEVDEPLQQMLDLVKKLITIKGPSEKEDTLSEMYPSFSLACIESACPLIPDDFRCPISLEIMKDPVIIATGQTYERANIQKWLEKNRTCPKTLQVLPHIGLTPNFVVRSLIYHWYEANGLDIPERACDSSRGGKPNSSDILLSEERGTVDEIIEHLRTGEIHLQRVAAAELRLLAKQNVESRICIAEAGAIPHLVSLLSSQDPETQEHAVTALLNLSIHERIKGIVVEAGAIPAIVKVLKFGCMEARGNAAATLFSLSVVDENKLTIGALGAIPALVDLLKNGSVQGRKDAACALFNLLIYQGNKSKAVRAGVVDAVMNLLANPSSGMLDEAVAILAILATHQEGRKAIGRAFAVPTLINLLQTGVPRTKENAAAILLALSLDNPRHLTIAGQLGVKRHLVEVANSGTERAMRKAKTLLEHLAMLGSGQE